MEPKSNFNQTLKEESTSRKYDIIFSFTDDNGNILYDSKEIEGTSKKDALDSYNALAAANCWIGVDNLDNVKLKI